MAWAIRSRRPEALGILFVFLLLVVTFVPFLYYGHILFLFLPVALLSVPVLARRVFTQPTLVLGLFLLVIVNLDFFRLGGRLTLDILVSSVLLWAVLVRLALEGRLQWKSGVEKAYLLYLAVTLISVVVSVNRGASAKNWSRDLEYFALFTFISGTVLSIGQRRALTACIIGSSVIVCVAGLLGKTFGIAALYGQDTSVAGGDRVLRIMSTLSHPVTLSHYLGYIGTVTFGLMLDRRWFRARYLLPLFALQMVVLYFSYGRTGWVELLVGVIAVLWLSGRRRLLMWALPFALFVLVRFVPTVIGRFETAFVESHENSLLWRIGLWTYALSLVPQRPLFGSGQDTFIQYVNYQTGFAAHHTWIGLLVETGVFGVLGFLVLMIVVNRALHVRYRQGRQAADPLLIPAYAGLTAMLVGSMAGDPFNLPSIAVYLWSTLALALGRWE